MSKRRLVLEFEGAVHHGSGLGLAGLVDRPFLRDAKGMPYLSGAAIKGKFRWAALRLLKSQEITPLCGQVAGQFCRRNPCQLCRIFGSPREAGKAFFEDAYPVEEQQDILDLAKVPGRTAGMTVRSTTGIDRVRRVVKRYHLFTTETAPPMTFSANIEGTLDDDWGLLENCAKILTHFGADGARGLGECRYILEVNA